MLPISFLSDYGLRDEWVGVCRGVIERIAPGTTVIDIAHEIPAADVRHGAFLLENAMRFLPPGIVLAVVDPGVGTDRRAVAVRTGDGMLLVGPDNGLLWPGAQAAGGVEVAVDVSAGPFRLDPVSRTFHGRDVFAPVAAELARGATLEEAGERIDPPTLARVEAAVPKVAPGTVHASVRLVDRFGNLQLQARSDDMARAGLEPGAGIDIAGRLEAVYGSKFADARTGAAVVYEDSAGWIAVALNQGRAADALGAQGGSALTLAQCGR